MKQAPRRVLVTFTIDDFIKSFSSKHIVVMTPKGKIPLVSCGDRNNGIIRYSKIPVEQQYQETITIAYNGQPLTTKFHPYVFAAKDDVAVCIPRRKLRLTTLLFLQYLLNREQWRFSYGRMLPPKIKSA